MNRLDRRQLLGGCATVGTVGLAGCVSQTLDAEETVNQAFGAEGISELVVRTTNGAIDVTATETETISLEGRKRATSDSRLADVEVVTERDGGTLRIEAETDESGLFSWLRNSPRADLSITVPETLTRTDAQTTNGSIELNSLDGESTARTTNGSIRMDALGGDITARTTNGSIELTDGSPSIISAETTNGRLSLSVLTEPDIEAKTTNGNVSLTLPSSVEPHLTFDTSNGRISIDGIGPMEVSGRGSYEARVGAATSRIRVSTTNGNLTVEGRSQDG